MKEIRFFNLTLYFLLLGSINFLNSEEIFDQSLEFPSLQKIEQLTFPEMGFEKAGEAYFSPDRNTILFQAVPKGKSNYQIYSMNITERVPVMVSTGKGACTCAYFRPDGKKIIFASSHEDPYLSETNENEVKNSGQYKWDFTPFMNIYEADPDGSNRIALTSGPAYHAECAYSPDGSHIVFASNESGSMNIYTMKSDGTDIKQVTFSTSCYNGGPFFSPDGTQIIFRADPEAQDFLQIYVINTDGTNQRQLTKNEAVNWAPYWHPNGKVIAYTTSIHGHRHYEIYLLNVETLVEHRLTHNSTFDGLPVFSLDGVKFLWTSKRGQDNTCQIFIADFILPNDVQ